MNRERSGHWSFQEPPALELRSRSSTRVFVLLPATHTVSHHPFPAEPQRLPFRSSSVPQHPTQLSDAGTVSISYANYLFSALKRRSWASASALNAKVELRVERL